MTRGGWKLGIVEAFLGAEAPIRGFLRRFVKDDHDIDDICQEAVTRALEAARTRNIEDPGAFLFGVARNIMRNEFDRKSRSLIDFVDDCALESYASNEPGPEQQLDERRRMLVFAEAVATLPDKCQRVFIMKKVFGYSHKEIAERLNISVSTVEKHAAAGLRRCMDHMEKVGTSGAQSEVSELRRKNPSADSA